MTSLILVQLIDMRWILDEHCVAQKDLSGVQLTKKTQTPMRTSVAFLVSFKWLIFYFQKNPVMGFTTKPLINEIRRPISLYGMKRPVLDKIASTLFQLETKRVEDSSEIDSKGRYGEPMEWSESTSLANQLSKIVATNSLGYQFKQFVADIIAGSDYDVELTQTKVNDLVVSNKVVMFSFTTCPFCRRAKDYFEENNIRYFALELDDLDGNEGNEIRAVLGRKTKRTSVPSIFVNGNFIGGCNDGPGLFPLVESGKFQSLLDGSSTS